MVDLPIVGCFAGGAGYAPLNETSLRSLRVRSSDISYISKGDPNDWKVRRSATAISTSSSS